MKREFKANKFKFDDFGNLEFIGGTFNAEQEVVERNTTEDKVYIRDAFDPNIYRGY